MILLKFYIITGLSGGGKSTAIHCFEDLGFFCIDNLPVKLIPIFLDLCRESEETINRVAVLIDLRDKDFLQEIEQILVWLRKEKMDIKVLFLEASDETLISRFSQTRRPHPLASHGSLIDAIREERKKLGKLRQLSDQVIDTSTFNIHELRTFINKLIVPEKQRHDMSISILSFGYKFGLPLEADLVFDVRFLPNPYFVPGLRQLTGRNKKINKFLESSGSDFNDFCKKLEKFLLFLIPSYMREGKYYLTIAIGCTGGRHRSVAVAEKLFSRLRQKEYNIARRHRDIQKHYPSE